MRLPVTLPTTLVGRVLLFKDVLLGFTDAVPLALIDVPFKLPVVPTLAEVPELTFGTVDDIVEPIGAELVDLLTDPVVAVPPVDRPDALSVEVVPVEFPLTLPIDPIVSVEAEAPPDTLEDDPPADAPPAEPPPDAPPPAPPAPAANASDDTLKVKTTAKVKILRFFITNILFLINSGLNQPNLNQKVPVNAIYAI